jgi:hypothetical protein
MNLASRTIRWAGMCACLGLLAFATAANGADTLEVILVRAANDGISDSALQAYLPLLAKSGFKSYRTVVRKTAPLQAGDVVLAQGFKATLGQAEGRRAPVTIVRGETNLIRTTVNFSPGHPVVLGTYDGDGGAKLIVVLVLTTP